MEETGSCLKNLKRLNNPVNNLPLDRSQTWDGGSVGPTSPAFPSAKVFDIQRKLAKYGQPSHSKNQPAKITCKTLK